MNYRQWKKRFKKTHGRNPYPWEDKKFRGCDALLDIVASLNRVVTTTREFLLRTEEVLFESFSRITEGLSEAFEEIAEAFKEAQKE